MYIDVASMYILCYAVYWEGILMPTVKTRTHKHFQLDAVKIKRAQKVLRAATETETIERALDLAIAEHRRNQLTLAANHRFADSGIKIKDVYGVLET
jgi:hypothetical protein